MHGAPADTSFTKVSELFETAEKKLKIVERLNDDGVLVPSVNELRYAGYHILKALNANTPKSKQEEITKAENHCQRAIYDAMELGILDRLNVIKQFKEDYRTVNVHDVVPTYFDEIKTVNKANKFINQNCRDNREKYYEECGQYFENLDRISNVFDSCRPEINKKLKLQRWAIFVAAAGLFVTVAGLLLQFILD